MNPEEKELLIDETFEKIFVGVDTELPVHMISEEIHRLDDPIELVTRTLTFDDFHDAWEYILENEEFIVGLTNPTIKPFHEIEEEPLDGRAERLKRYAKMLLKEDKNGGKTTSN